jgi:hypothetical protein
MDSHQLLDDTSSKKWTFVTKMWYQNMEFWPRLTLLQKQLILTPAFGISR